MKSVNRLMKATTLTLAVCIALLTYAQSPQDGGGRADKIEALRIAFISQQLNLTPAEAQKFWPVYNQYHSDMKALRQNFKLPEGQNPSAEQQLDFEQRKLDLKKKYKTEFEGCLGREKVNRLYGLEDEFRKKMQDLREQRQQNGAGPRGGGMAPGGQRPGGPR